MTPDPVVSAVIPTAGRRASLARAVRSAVQQATPTEVIVVLDAPEHRASVRKMLEMWPHRLLLTDHLGPSGARNAGVQSASAGYVAFLDDDDEWLPGKNELQLGALTSAGGDSFSVGLSEFVRASGVPDASRPKRHPRSDESMANYLVERRRLRYGRTYFQTCSLLARTRDLVNTPWDEALSVHEDWDLVVRLVARGLRPVIVDQPVVRVFQGSEGSISARSDPSASLQWAIKHRQRLSGRAKADFLWIQIVAPALRQRRWDVLRASLPLFPSSPPHLAAVARGLLELAR